MHEITGPIDVLVGHNYNYSVTPDDGVGYTWSLLGGNIIAGQGTDTITVTWTDPGQCSVQVAINETGGGQDIIVVWPTAG